MKKVLLVFGTRPEAIKMAPVYEVLKATPGLDVRVATRHPQVNVLQSGPEARS